MFFEKTFQSQTTPEVTHESTKICYQQSQELPKEKILIGNVKEKIKAYLIVFLETSSIHGLSHIVARRRHFFESFLWFTIIALSVFGSVYLSRTTWIRYQYSPTVVSMDRDMFAWNTTFPCVTICPHKKLSEKKLELYLKKSPEQDKSKLKDFIEQLSFTTYENFDKLPPYNGIPSDKYLELLVELAASFKPLLTIGANGVYLGLQPILTEMGLCYSINSKIAVYMSPNYIFQNRWDMMKTYNQTFFVHPLDGEVFAQLINLSTAYDVYIHGPLEIPDISTKHQYSANDFYMKLYVTALSVYTAPEAAKLTVPQRKCRFFEENNLKHSPVYSYNMCRMECRIKLCLKHCQCIPHFYRKVGDEKVCDVAGLKCLANYRGNDVEILFCDVAFLYELYQLQDKNRKKINCGCLPNCDDVNYVIQSNVLQEWTLGTNLQWGIVTYPRMRYRRDIIFGFTDVLVAVGSMAGLFLGCSVLSFMEIVYFLTFRLAFYTRANIEE